MKMKVPFIELAAKQQPLYRVIRESLDTQASRGDFILGADVKKFEGAFAAYTGSRFAIGLNSGTDALFLSLMALGIGRGDEVIVPAFTFIATANAVSYCGARPVFCDIDTDTFCIDPAALAKAITPRTKGVIPVHLFGQCADMDAVLKACRPKGIAVIEDACQAHGAAYGRKIAGAIGEIGCFSFYPTKNLGGWGDGGMAVTDNVRLRDGLLLLRDCGRTSRYEHGVVGYNSRLDTMQATVLTQKLRYLDKWNTVRRQRAALYTEMLAGIPEVACPVTLSGNTHVFHVYAIKAMRRDALQEFLCSRGIGTMINYPLPLHLQKAYAGFGYKRGDFPVAEKTCGEILSLPMHPFLSKAHVRLVCAAIRAFYRQGR